MPDLQPDVEPDDEPAAEPEADFEGPRRVARREREQRRGVAARARVIEDARREAKRQARGAGLSGKPTAAATTQHRRVVRGLRVVTGAIVLTVISVGLGLMLYFTPMMSVRNLVIDGIDAVSRDEVAAAVAVPSGTPLLQVDTDKVADRVATIRRVASVRVQRDYPSALRVSVVERVAIAVKDGPDGPHLFDRDGVDFATAPPPPGVPYLDVERPGPNDPATKAALGVLTALSPDVAGQVSRVAAPSVASITLTLGDGRVVIWGTTDRTEDKARTLVALLTRPAHTYDVSSPDLPTTK